MSNVITLKAISDTEFAAFGDLIDTTDAPDKLINQDMCARFHDRANMNFGDGKAGISLFRAKTRSLPLALEMVERHPEGSQAFIPMSEHGFLVVVAPDENGKPGQPIAFQTLPGQVVNFHRGTWHGILCPLHAPGIFAVIDRIGSGDNLEEYWFEIPYVIEAT